MAVSRAELSISGKRYLLSCAPGQEARLEELGARFDARVRELAEAMGDIGPERLFLAAGLSFIDELDIETAGGNARALDERIRGLEQRAAFALAEAAARIEALSVRVEEAGEPEGR